MPAGLLDKKSMVCKHPLGHVLHPVRPRRWETAPRCTKGRTSGGEAYDIGPIGSRAVLWGSALAFAADAFDVESPMSFNLFRKLDLDTHNWVINHIPESWQHVFFDKVLSDVFIIVPVVAWIIADQIWEAPRRKRDASQEDLWIYTEGGVSPGGYASVAAGTTFLMLVLKEFFARSRPHNGIFTSSFPSGHTMVAVMITSMFLLRIKFKKEGTKEIEDLQQSWMLDAAKSMEYIILTLAAITTAAGRIGADAHWLSDTVAGMFMGLWATSLLANIYCWDTSSDK